MSSRFNSRVDEFLRKNSADRDRALNKIAEVGKDNIDSETPVDTGELKSKNNSKASGNTVIFYNTKGYAPFVELGTYRMRANPFMRRGINKSRREFVNILKKELGI